MIKSMAVARIATPTISRLTTPTHPIYVALATHQGAIGRMCLRWITIKLPEDARIVTPSPIVIPLPMRIVRAVTVLTVGAGSPIARYFTPIFPLEAAPVATTVALPEANPGIIAPPLPNAMCVMVVLTIGSKM
jgi:hypothetical protein